MNAYALPMRTKYPSPRAARERLKLTQIEVARRSGLDPSTVYRIEKRGQWPRRGRTLRALTAALNLPA